MSKSVKINDVLQVDRNLFNFLNNSGNLICSLILYAAITNPDINFISPCGKDMVSFLPMNKVKSLSIFDDPYQHKLRTSMKVGKMITKLLDEELCNKNGVRDIHREAFVNLYKSWFDTSNYSIEVVEGEDIRKWYSARNYDNPSLGTLWNSCMRYDERLKFLDLYCQNLKMLVMINKTPDGDKLRARALLWDKVEIIKPKNTYPSSIKVMDRIYTIFDSDVISMKKWAEENGYIPKFEQNSKSHQVFDIKGEPQLIQCKVTLDNYQFKYYPYLDTFPFFNPDCGFFTNSEFGLPWEYKLVQADGSLFRQREEEPEDVPDEDFVFDEDDDI
jgi:hypothetical protein